MGYQSIKVDVTEGVYRIILNRPEKLNSLNESMHGELGDAVRQAHSDSAIRSLLISGAGRAFCAGQDLEETVDEGNNVDVEEVLKKYYNPLIKLITGMDKPVICAVNGVAAGAGANIALACDIVLAARSASFIQAFSKIGLIPDAGGTWILPRLIGHARASTIAMLGEKINAEKAEQWGMIWQCVDDDELMPTAENLARHLAQQATTSLAYTKKLMQLSWQNDLPSQLDLEAAFQVSASHTGDCKEGVAAFRDKRSAIFTGK